MKEPAIVLLVALICCVTRPPSAMGDATSPSTGKQYECPPCGCASDGKVLDKPGTCPDCGMALVEKSSIKTLNVAIVVFQGVELLDFAGPGEVFEAARYHTSGSGITFNVFTVAPQAGKIVSQRFVTIEPQYTIANCPTPNVLVVPGGGIGTLLDDASFMMWAKDASKQADLTLSVCNGVFVPAKNGELKGRSATTHIGSIRHLRDSYPDTTVLENIRFVDEGKLITSAGVSAGIDGALHAVAKLANFAAAASTARYMEYEWHAADRTRSLLANLD